MSTGETSGGEVKGFVVDLTLPELRPNHKYRLALMAASISGRDYWLADLGVVKNDESVYLMPLIQRACTLTASNPTGGQPLQFQALQNSGFHVSFHDTGAVNLNVGDQSRRLRPKGGKRTALGRLLTIVVNSTASLAEAENINNLPVDKELVPLPPIWSEGPVGLTVFRSLVDDSTWRAPILADLIQINLHLPIRGKSVRYHVVVWQSQRLKPPPPPAEVAVYFPKE